MIEVDISAEPSWQEQDWQSVCERSIAAAFSVAPFRRLTETTAAVCISVRLAENAEVQALNQDYRNKNKPTNILTFPMISQEMLGSVADKNDGEILLGDMILAHEVCVLEAEEKTIPLSQHVAHLIIHGTLHLLGFDHLDDQEANAMENMEVKALASLGHPNPYSE